MLGQLDLNFRSGIIAPILSLYIRQRGMNLTQVGLLRTASIMGWLLFEPLSGWVADRVRKKRMIVLAVIGSSRSTRFTPPRASSSISWFSTSPCPRS